MTGNVTSLINTDGIGSALMYIADKIGITVAQMYEIYVHAQQTMAFLQILFISIWVISIVVTIIITYVWIIKYEKDATVEDKTLGPLLVGCVVAAIMALLLAALYNPVLAYMCPDYTALRSMMSDIGIIASALK